MLTPPRFIFCALLALVLAGSVLPAHAADCDPDTTKPVLTIVQREDRSSYQNYPGVFSGWFYDAVPCGSDWAAEGPSSISALDNCDGAVPVTVVIHDVQVVGMSPVFTPIANLGLTESTWTTRPGMYRLIYSAKDGAGNSSSETVGAQVQEGCAEEGEPVEGEPVVEGEPEPGAPVITIQHREENGGYCNISLLDEPVFVYDSIECGADWAAAGPLSVTAVDSDKNPLTVSMLVYVYMYDSENKVLKLVSVSNQEPWTASFGYYQIRYKATDSGGKTAQVTVMAIPRSCETGGEIIGCHPFIEKPILAVQQNMEYCTRASGSNHFLYTLDCWDAWEFFGPVTAWGLDICRNKLDVVTHVEFWQDNGDAGAWEPIETLGLNMNTWSSRPGSYRVFYMVTNGDPKGVWVSRYVIADVADNCTYYSGGAGTEGDPYLIANVRDWRRLMLSESDWDKHFRVIADIDLTQVHVFPVGNADVPFTGVMDGQGHTLSNCAVENVGGFQNNVGLFGAVGGGAYIHNLHLENASVPGNQGGGGLAGSVTESRLENCSVSGIVKGTTFIGALVGHAINSEITSCSADAEVEASGHAGVLIGVAEDCAVSFCSSAGLLVSYTSAGGLVGRQVGGIISDSTSAAEVQGFEDTGGFVGTMQGGEISRSTATGKVVGTYANTGGFVGHMNQEAMIFLSSASGQVEGALAAGGFAGKLYQATIRQSSAVGSVTGEQRVGGLVGQLLEGFVRNSYARGSASAPLRYAGGLIGTLNYGTVKNCYSTGVAESNILPGGLIGYYINGFVQQSYWDTEASGLAASGAGEGRTTEEMTAPHAENTYLDWDFGEIWIEDTDGTVNDGYPYLHTGVVDIDDCDPDITPPEIKFEHRPENSQWLEDIGFYVYTLNCGDDWNVRGPISVEAVDNCAGYFLLHSEILGLIEDEEENLEPVPLEDLGVDINSWTGRPGLYVVNYSATDISGNSTEVHVLVLIEDNCYVPEGEPVEGEIEGEDECDPDEAAPEVVLSHRSDGKWDAVRGMVVYKIDCSDSWSEKGPSKASAVDNCDVDLVPVMTIAALIGGLEVPLEEAGLDPGSWTRAFGEYVITYTATDQAGNTAFEKVGALVADRSAPEIHIVQADANVAWDNAAKRFVYTLEVGSDWEVYGPKSVTADDKCEGALEVTRQIFVLVPGQNGEKIITLAEAGLDEENWSRTLGTYLVRYSAEDDSGNIDTESVAVKLRDTTAPVVVVTNGENGSWSDDEVPVFVYSLDCQDDWAAKGPIDVTATDNYDGDLPVTTVIRKLRLRNGVYIEETLESQGLNENNWTGHPGLYLIRYTAVDSSGNSSTESIRALVEDRSAPVITIVHPTAGGGEEPYVYTLDCGDSWETHGPVSVTATDLCDGDRPVVSVITTADGTGVRDGWTKIPGNYTAKYTATDKAGKTATETVQIVISDKTAPVVTIAHRQGSSYSADENLYTLNCGDLWINIGPVSASAWDQCDGVISKVTSVITALVPAGEGYEEVSLESLGLNNTTWVRTPGLYLVRYTAKDAAGNVGTAVTRALVDDRILPVFTATHREGNGVWLEAGLFQYTLECGADWRSQGPSRVVASDNCDGSLPVSSVVEALVDGETVPVADPNSWTSVPGLYVVRYTATDRSGNKAELLVQALIADCDEVEGEEEDLSYHPFDGNNNNRINGFEASDSIRAWQNGDFPMEWALRALYIYKQGGAYHYDDAFDPPLCWVPDKS